MLRFPVSFLLCLGLFPQLLTGATIQLIDGLPGAYVPGQPLSFDVRLPAISNLGSYNIDLVLESTAGLAGTDYFFDVASTMPVTTHYVFPSAANYFDATNVDLPSRHRLTISDFDFAGVNVVSGVNDRLATVVLRTLPSFHEPLTIFVDAPLLILDTPNVTPTPVGGFETLQNDIALADPVQLAAVPEPSGLVLGVAAICAVRNLNRRGRRPILRPTCMAE